MKYLLIMALVISFPGIAFLGFADMHHHNEMQNHTAVCLFAASEGVNCPGQSNLLEFLNFHLGALKDYSTSAAASGVLLLIISLLTLLASALIKSIPPNLTPASRQSGKTGAFFIPERFKFISWLSLLENSPSFI